MLTIKSGSNPFKKNTDTNLISIAGVGNNLFLALKCSSYFCL